MAAKSQKGQAGGERKGVESLAQQLKRGSLTTVLSCHSTPCSTLQWNRQMAPATVLPRGAQIKPGSSSPGSGPGTALPADPHRLEVCSQAGGHAALQVENYCSLEMTPPAQQITCSFHPLHLAWAWKKQISPKAGLRKAVRAQGRPTQE